VRITLLLTVLAMTLAGCATGEGTDGGSALTAGPTPGGSGSASTASPTSVVIVLPPADGLADDERQRVRLLVERAAEESRLGEPVPVLLTPASADALVWTVESAVRRVGTSGVVCLVGAESAATVAPIMALYPATRFCLLPSGDASGDAVDDTVSRVVRSPRSLTADVDVGRLGRELGVAARAAAGEGTTVLVVAGGDAMLDGRWAAGVVAGATGSVHTVATAEEALALIDDQAASLAAGVVPGSAQARAGDPSAPVIELPDRQSLPLALTLPTVAVVVLDASPEAALLVGPLIARGLLLVGPRSLLTTLPDGLSDDGVVLRWRVRWDVPLAELLRRTGMATEPADTVPGTGPVWEDTVVLEPARAHVAP
jgi:hypothetical protein